MLCGCCRRLFTRCGRWLIVFDDLPALNIKEWNSLPWGRNQISLLHGRGLLRQPPDRAVSLSLGTVSHQNKKILVQQCKYVSSTDCHMLIETIQRLKAGSVFLWPLQKALCSLAFTVCLFFSLCGGQDPFN